MENRLVKSRIMRIVPILGAGLLLAAPSLAQDRPIPSSDGDCRALFDFVTGYVERNYAGFPDKVTPSDREGYEGHKAALLPRAATATSDTQCRELLVDYVDYFSDPHLRIVHAPAAASVATGENAVRERFADWPTRSVSESDIRGYLDGLESGAAPIEGIWSPVGTDYRFAIVPAASGRGDYEAVTLSADGIWWRPGQVKAKFVPIGPDEYRVDYYLRDHSLRSDEASVGRGVLSFSITSPWAQVYPRNASGYDLAHYREREANGELGIHELDPDTLLLRLPAFDPAAEAAIRSLVDENWERLSAVGTLIIDVRGNQGGGAGAYHAIRPLLYTGPMVTPGVSHYATADNIRVMQEVIDHVELTPETAEALEGIVAGMHEHLGGFVPTSDDRYEVDEVLPTPRRVAVLTDRRCISTCEAFVWIAMQSGKTTVFGENTGGFMDYGSAVMVDTPLPVFRLQMPMGRSNRVPQGMPLDNVGIEPDVRVPDEVLYWVDWVREQLR